MGPEERGKIGTRDILGISAMGAHSQSHQGAVLGGRYDAFHGGDRPLLSSLPLKIQMVDWEEFNFFLSRNTEYPSIYLGL